MRKVLCLPPQVLLLKVVCLVLRINDDVGVYQPEDAADYSTVHVSVTSF